MKILGIDYGESKVGVAIGDTESGVASPLTIIKNGGWKNLLNQLLNTCSENQVELIVVGMPVNTSDGQSKQMTRINEFGRKLAEISGIDVLYYDERFSTQAARRLSVNNKKHEDDLAAMLILQSYFDSRK